MSDKITPERLQRPAIVYVRQSSQRQLLQNTESARLQYAMAERVRVLGWKEIEIVDEDQGKSAATTSGRTGFQRIVAQPSSSHSAAR
jgi:DNA invertase Pin-like site-specific DNA recombinase